MGAHLIDGEFQSDKYPTCPRGKVPLSVKDATAQDLLWEYAMRRREVDAQFANDLEMALSMAGYRASPPPVTVEELADALTMLLGICALSTLPPGARAYLAEVAALLARVPGAK